MKEKESMSADQCRKKYLPLWSYQSLFWKTCRIEWESKGQRRPNRFAELNGRVIYWKFCRFRWGIERHKTLWHWRLFDRADCESKNYAEDKRGRHDWPLKIINQIRTDLSMQERILHSSWCFFLSCWSLRFYLHILFLYTLIFFLLLHHLSFFLFSLFFIFYMSFLLS